MCLKSFTVLNMVLLYGAILITIAIILFYLLLFITTEIQVADVKRPSGRGHC